MMKKQRCCAIEKIYFETDKITLTITNYGWTYMHAYTWDLLSSVPVLMLSSHAKSKTISPKLYCWRAVTYTLDGSFSFLSFIRVGLLRLQQIYQGLNPGNETFQVEIVKRINNASEAIEFLQKIEHLNRWTRKYVVLDCPTDMAKEIVKNHVRDVSLGKRTYHYLLSGLVSFKFVSIPFHSHFSLTHSNTKINL